jgi:2-succinyl-5-enolpyruvyl-6-hydroxy-3-cyclohexene-1-carboxylate synthase
MPIDFSNTNSVWASLLAETLQRLGLATAVICPGSRSAPLAVAFAKHPQIEAIPVLDERSAGFFALGLARQSGLPVVLVCTSGTAGANFYPAVIEARESRVPLLVLTADRPPELRECHAGQAIDQQKLFGSFPNWYAELALPSVAIEMLAYLRQTLIQAWERSLWPIPGAVHLNLPFRDPLAPVPDATTDALRLHFQLEDFLGDLTPATHLSTWRADQLLSPVQVGAIPLHTWQQCERGLIIAGPAQPRDPKQYCLAIAQLSQLLGWPVLAEGLSPLRNYADLNPYLISTYDLILRNRPLATQLAATSVVRIGEMPTSKELRSWLSVTQPRQWIIDGSDRNLDPLHGKTTHLRLSIEQLASTIERQPNDYQPKTLQPYLAAWCTAESKLRHRLDRAIADLDLLFEGKAAWLLSQHLPTGTPLFIANSMPVRDVEYFWVPGNSAVQPWFNRGANGIDGTLSTALGIAHRNQSSVLLTGDLALLHDTNGFLLRNKSVGHLTVVLINNDGGGIFEMLPISRFDPPFEEFFATPQQINFAQLCASYQVEHQLIQSWQQLIQQLNPLPATGIRVLELQTNRQADAKWRQTYLSELAAQCLGG